MWFPHGIVFDLSSMLNSLFFVIRVADLAYVPVYKWVVYYNHWTGLVVEWNGGLKWWNVFYRVRGHCSFSFPCGTVEGSENCCCKLFGKWGRGDKSKKGRIFHCIRSLLW